MVLPVESENAKDGNGQTFCLPPFNDDRQSYALFVEKETMHMSQTILVTKDDTSKTEVRCSTVDGSEVLELLKQREDREKLQKREVMEEDLGRNNKAVTKGNQKPDELNLQRLEQVEQRF
jgi:hypothetical protein